MTVIILSISGLLLITLVFGKINLSLRFKNEVKELFSQSKNVSENIFNYKQLIGLPEPVQRYFKYVLKEGQPYISYVRLIHNGEFKTGLNKAWAKIKGEQYFTVEKPGYIWKGTASLVTARDMYISDKGRLIVTLLALINVVDGKGKIFNEAEFQRWLAESVWFPTNLLPSERLQWSAIDADTARLSFKYKELFISYLVTFNKAGEITQMETKRYMDDKNKETWLVNLTQYREMNGIIVPTNAEAIWILKKGDYSYAKFVVKKMEYNKPERF
jgi:hypothetical protein